MSPELHDRIMNRASRLWHEQGRPSGSYRLCWQAARREVLADEAGVSVVYDELCTWAPARPLPRHRPSAFRRLAHSTERGLRRILGN